MKYSFMSFSTPQLDLLAMIKAAKQYGYNGIEPRLDSGHFHGIEVSATEEERAKARETAAREGIELACLATSLTYADPSHRDKVIEQSRQRIDLAGDLGVPVIRVFGGPIPKGLGREQAINLVADSLRSLADHASDRGVAICMETHDDWCDPAHVAAVMEMVNHPFIAVNWDIMHPVRTGKATIEESYKILKPWIRHLHVHDGLEGTTTLAPIGEGSIDHKGAIQIIEADSYKGYISGEWIDWEPFEVHLPRELHTLKSYEKSL